MFLYRLEKELFAPVQVLESLDSKKRGQDAAKKTILEGLTVLSSMFKKTRYILGDEFSLLDVAIAPLLWRLDYYGIKSSKLCSSILKYGERIFQRRSFIDSLTPAEKAMRK